MSWGEQGRWFGDLHLCLRSNRRVYWEDRLVVVLMTEDLDLDLDLVALLLSLFLDGGDGEFSLMKKSVGWFGLWLLISPCL